MLAQPMPINRFFIYQSSKIGLIGDLKTCSKKFNKKVLKRCKPEYEQLHAMNKRATPKMMMDYSYRHAIMLYKLYYSNDDDNDWIDLNV